MTKEKLPDGFYFRDSDHSYFMDGERMTGVTTILGTIAKPSLIPWAARMAVEHVRDGLDSLEPVRRTLDDRTWNDTIMVMLEVARVAHARKRDTAADAGTDLHALVENWVRACIDENDGYPKVYEPGPIEDFTKWAIKENIRFLAAEKRLYSKELWVAGTCDLIFEKDGKKYIGDIKTYAKIWDRVPFFQCAGYASMYEEMSNGLETIAGYAVIRISKDNSFEAKWSFDTVGDTKAFFACVELYRQLKEFNK